MRARKAQGIHNNLAHDTQSEKEKVMAGNESLKRKVQWGFLVCLMFARKAYPPSADVSCQAGSANDMVSVSVNTQPGVCVCVCACMLWMIMSVQAMHITMTNICVSAFANLLVMAKIARRKP